ncbi:hypothetical protein HDV00_005368 [Rhizophlyctis rosea]|nr:hypothetical protein HDV00_005368 [Rhizophlyctis rosea]
MQGGGYGERTAYAPRGGGGGFYRKNNAQSAYGQQNNFAVGDKPSEGKRVRKAIQRRTVDYNSVIIRHLELRTWQRDRRDHHAIQPDPNFISEWTPEGRRLITGASSGEFTLWNGLTFNFETILQAHDKAVRTMVWSHNDTWMITGDDAGVIKYWQSNMNNLKLVNAHKETVRDLCFSPTDAKYASCSDDGTIKIWSFADAIEERVLTGHGWDVKCIDWHPSKGLLASGSKDNLAKLWDPKTGKALSTLHGHKNTIMGLEWNSNGNWLVTASRDQLLRVYDIRTMRELQAFRGHKKDVQSVAWHPHHESLFVSGGSDGSMMFWLVGTENSVGGMEGAHESSVFALDWHPMGHILVSGSNDHTTRFWTRNRPGDVMHDRFSYTKKEADMLGLKEEEEEEDEEDVQATPQELPGLGDFATRQAAARARALDAGPSGPSGPGGPNGSMPMPQIPGMGFPGPSSVGGRFGDEFERDGAGPNKRLRMDEGGRGEGDGGGRDGGRGGFGRGGGRDGGRGGGRFDRGGGRGGGDGRREWSNDGRDNRRGDQGMGMGGRGGGERGGPGGGGGGFQPPMGGGSGGGGGQYQSGGNPNFIHQEANPNSIKQESGGRGGGGYRQPPRPYNQNPNQQQQQRPPRQYQQNQQNFPQRPPQQQQQRHQQQGPPVKQEYQQQVKQEPGTQQQGPGGQALLEQLAKQGISINPALANAFGGGGSG